jgi:hypothetical protein
MDTIHPKYQQTKKFKATDMERCYCCILAGDEVRL